MPHARGAIPGAMVAPSLSFSFGDADEEPEGAGPAEGKRANKQKVSGHQCAIVDCGRGYLALPKLSGGVCY